MKDYLKWNGISSNLVIGNEADWAFIFIALL